MRMNPGRDDPFQADCGKSFRLVGRGASDSGLYRRLPAISMKGRIPRSPRAESLHKPERRGYTVSAPEPMVPPSSGQCHTSKGLRRCSVVWRSGAVDLPVIGPFRRLHDVMSSPIERGHSSSSRPFAGNWPSTKWPGLCMRPSASTRGCHEFPASICPSSRSRCSRDSRGLQAWPRLGPALAGAVDGHVTAPAARGPASIEAGE
jgi:hypothetical protein